MHQQTFRWGWVPFSIGQVHEVPHSYWFSAHYFVGCLPIIFPWFGDFPSSSSCGWLYIWNPSNHHRASGPNEPLKKALSHLTIFYYTYLANDFSYRSVHTPPITQVVPARTTQPGYFSGWVRTTSLRPRIIIPFYGRKIQVSENHGKT